MATLNSADDLLSPLELTALPPLSPTMERAFSEAFADMSELEKSEKQAAVVKLEPSEEPQYVGSDDEASTRKYSELSLMAHALEEDQSTLQNLLQTHEYFQQTVGVLYDQKQAEDKDIWDSGVPPSSSFAAKFRQHSMAECYAIVRESYEHIQRFGEGEHYETTGANIMGWTDKRKYDEGSLALQYAFTKCFPLEDPEQLLMRTWDTFANGDKMEYMSFDSSVNTRFEVVFRLQTPTGYTLCMRTIPAPEITDAMEPHEYFYDVFHWTHFNRLYDEYGNPAGCELVASGSIADQNQLKSTYWLFELVCAILRWENACVAPLFLKHI
ncbi:hypothetical protein BBO99_00000212 [Phytophthora kernoviae]|uniref:Uncharacterized protein n=2 Tax=Phytophthora kernoviae TaxID=325452 RepID=A0A421H2W4_9STRA|nr:hypothetical protein G195_002373 [Phytophthora kernoviae 00238/432]KAG2530865.1 hypothetical protein JM18_001316 [Phytophthora kernoviae]RLN85734.1 hypothetical protein BBO99_00000212 [Phytophthora kernoviae]